MKSKWFLKVYSGVCKVVGGVLGFYYNALSFSVSSTPKSKGFYLFAK